MTDLSTAKNGTRFRIQVWGWRIVAIIAVGVAWYGAAYRGSASSVLLPNPLDVVEALGELVSSSELWSNTLVTLIETVAAFLIACLLSAVAAMIASQSKFWADVLEPMLGWGYMVPQVVFFPLFIMWLGIDSISKIGFAAVGAFFPLGLAAIRAVKTVDPRFIRAARAFGASGREITWGVRWPAALPLFVSGLRVSAALSLILVILAEMLAATSGLGYMLTRETQLYHSAQAFAVLIVIIAVSGVFYTLISRIEVDRRRR